jgi:mannose/cellobiose epimerase-like protein (N-acyl-D-glucosamine 2-epimerase family)
VNQTAPTAVLSQLTLELGNHVRTLEQFWTERALDPINGGYRTSFDGEGTPIEEDRKYLLSHMRLLWSFASLTEAATDKSLMSFADVGFDYITQHFLDRRHGGWYWMLNVDGAVRDGSKLVYGQSFAIYALATYARVAKNDEALGLAVETFDRLMVNATDTAWGGFFENFDSKWALAGAGGGGDRKSLDIHMHLLEAFTELARATGDSLHLRRLGEIRALILSRMVDRTLGVGGNQYDARYTELSPIVIEKTWIAERNPTIAGTVLESTTSYGHNLELGWLLSRANNVLGTGDGADVDLVRTIADHTLRFGYDSRNGGIYREGPPNGSATDLDKEFWQNAEALVGFLNAYELTADDRFLQAFHRTWIFAVQHLIHPKLGEWRIRTTREGAVIDGALGNHWTGGYHTIRAALESHRRLQALQDKLDFKR